MYQNHRDILPNLITLAELALILPIHTSDCERGFSKQNLIKSKSRNRIEDAALNRLMVIWRNLTLHNLSLFGKQRKTGEFFTSHRLIYVH